MKKHETEEDVFQYTEFDKESKANPTPAYNFDKLYERANAELALQQTKRDQIITLYLAIFSFLIPFALSTDALNLLSKGLIFCAVGIIGILFSMIAIRYRIYKEVYWLCCESITCLMNVQRDQIDKGTVHAIFYQCMKKRGSGYVKNGKWRGFAYFRKNIFSSETLHYIVIALLTTVFLGLGAFLCVPAAGFVRLAAALGVGLLVFVGLMWTYFSKCSQVYAVLADGKDSSFNQTFSKAWFLHFYLS